ncbi:hypothetical protein ACJMK2_013617, partial [Sinanodonta woodiana]
AQINTMQIKIGDLDNAMSDAILVLQNSDQELASLENVNGDPKCLETHMKKLQ